MPTLKALASSPLAAARCLLALHLLPLVLACTALAWARLAVCAVFCAAAARRRRCPTLACIYGNSLGGYHNDLRRARASLERTVLAGAPQLDWATLPRFTLYFDDQLNYPAERCRASFGFVVATGAQDAQAAAEAWRAHPLVVTAGLRVGVLPEGEVLAADVPHASGSALYLLSMVRALHCLRTEVRATGVHTKVPGLLEVYNPSQCRLSWMLPLEGRADMLPFCRS